MVIVGGAIAALVTAIASTTMNSKTHRELATQDTVMRSYAESVKEAVRSTCVGGAPTFTVPYVPPTGYAASANSNLCPTNPTTPRTFTITVSKTPADGTAPKSMQIVGRIA
jgi:hypothetical protein